MDSTLLFHKFIGDHSTELRHRLLNAFCFMQMWCFLLFAVFDFGSSLILSANYWILDIVFFVFSGSLYYFSFYKKQFATILRISLFVTYLAIVLSWYNMGGISMIIGVAFVVVICYYTFMLSQKWYLIFSIFNAIFILSLTIVQLKYPNFVPKVADPATELVEQTIAVLAMCFVLFVGIYIIKTSRDYERNDANTYRNKLEHLNKVQSQMISIISHDIRSPMLNVQLMLNMMENGLMPKEKIPEMARQIGNNMSNSRELLESMVSWTRSQVRQISTGAAVADNHTEVNPLITKNMVEWTTAAKRKQITLTYTATCADNTAISAEANLLLTALRNIVLNAIKFTPTDGNIAIKSEANTTHLSVSVTDNGMGMSPERCAQLFQTKLNASKGTSGERGSGIGLWIVNDMLQNNNATISVSSEEGKGSIFTLVFPLAKA